MAIDINSVTAPSMINAAIMNIRMFFPEAYRNKGGSKIDALRRVFAVAAPVISEEGGILTGVTEEGISAVFENGGENVVQAALKVFGSAAGSLTKDEITRLRMGICAGAVYLAKINYGKYSTPVAVSDGMKISRRLSESALQYDCSILVTDAAVARIRSFENRFNNRRLGMIVNKDTKKESILYDVFDSDPTDLKYRKRRSKLAFETGVSLFLRGEYLQARAYFIEILKYDRNDKTAKRYILKCDRVLSGESDKAQEKYLEIW